MLEVLLDLAEFVHEALELGNSVVMEQYAIKFASAVFITIFFH